MRVNPWLLWTLLLSLLILGLQSIPTDKPTSTASQATVPDTLLPGDHTPSTAPTPATEAQASVHATQPPIELKVYRWQDTDGEWHVSNEPPPAGAAFQVREYSR
ncbi:MAG: DUF4124 domain-containing protein [Chromatiales bacterium]|nr:DUF4124 domain-containing protein [Chromatiales bacterium]